MTEPTTAPAAEVAAVESPRAAALRVNQNLYFLLVEGTFPGKFAQGLLEAQQYMADLISKLEKEVKNEQQPPQAQG